MRSQNRQKEKKGKGLKQNTSQADELVLKALLLYKTDSI